MTIDFRRQLVDRRLVQGIGRRPESIREQQHADRDAGQTETQQRSTADAVEQGQRNDGEYQIDEPDQDRLHERRIGADAGLLEDHGRVEEYGIDPGDLLQDADPNTDRQNEPQRRMQQRAQRGGLQLCILGDAGLDGPQVLGRVLRSGDARHHPVRFFVAAPHRQPTRALGHREQCQPVHDRGQGLEPEHPAPVPFTQSKRFAPRSAGIAERQDQVIAEERGGNTDNNIELVERHQPPARLGRRHFRDVHRGDDQRRPDAQSSDHPGNNEHRETGRHCRPDGRQREQYRGDLQNRAPADAVAQRPGQQHPERGGQSER